MLPDDGTDFAPGVLAGWLIMARFRLFTSAQAVAEAGYRPCSFTDADTYRRLGVPLYQRGLSPIAGVAKGVDFFVPAWAEELVEGWPDGVELRMQLEVVIRRVVATGDLTLARAAGAVARLNGPEAVAALILAHINNEP